MKILNFYTLTSIIAAFLTALPMSYIAAVQNEPPAKHVILISLDGFNPQWYQDKSWAMPFLQQKAREGAYARRSRPVFPSTTRPGHTTLMTGRLPVNHGVFNNSIPYQLKEGTSLFHGVEEKGGVTASVVWVGADAAPVDHLTKNLDYIDFSDVRVLSPEDDLIIPADWGNKESHTPGFERYTTGVIRDAHLASIAVTYIVRHKPDFLALRFNDTDKVQHMNGREGAAVSGKVASIDLALAEVYAAVERAGIADETVIIVAGDHGMDNIYNTIAPNAWLDNAELGSKDGVHFETYGGSAFLHNATDKETEEIRKLLENLTEEEKKSVSILNRAELDELGADPRATLALTAAEGYAFNNEWNQPAIKSTNLHGSHGSLASPETPNNYTGFVIWGAGIKSGVVLDEINLQDIAPTAAELLGISIGDPDGRSRLPELIDESK